MGKPWVKVWCEMRHDRKLRTVDPAWRWIWCALLMVAADYADTGELRQADGTPLDDTDLADEVGVAPEVFALAREYFLRRGMLARQEDGVLVVVNYAKRQAALDRTAARRQATWRARRRENDDAPLRNALRNGDSNALRNALRNGDSNALRNDDSNALRNAQEQQKHRSIEATEQQNNRTTEDLVTASSSSALSADTSRAAADDDDAGLDDDGIRLPPNDFDVHQRVAWELLLMTAPDFDRPGRFVRRHDPYSIALWAMIVGERAHVSNPAGLIRRMVQDHIQPPATTAHKERYYALVTQAQQAEEA